MVRKKTYIKLLFLNILIISMFKTSAQSNISIGSWQTHFNYEIGKNVFLLDDKLFFAGERAVFYIDRTENTIQYLDKTQGFSDVSIACIATSEQKNALIIAYENSNIDIYHNGSIFNIPELYTKQITGSKNINSIYCHGNFAYLACDFGIVCINLDKKIISDTWRFEENDIQYPVLNLTICRDSVYAVTSNAIFSNKLNFSQINDFSTWNQEFFDTTKHIFTNIAALDNILFCAAQIVQKDTSFNKIYVNKNNQWQIHDDFDTATCSTMKIQENYLTICYNNKFEIWSKDNLNNFSKNMEGDNIWIKPIDIAYDGKDIFIASYYRGLVEWYNDYWHPITISTPAQNTVWRMDWKKGKLAIAHGGHSDWRPLWLSGKSSVLQKNKWEIIDNFLDKKSVSDLIDIKIAPYDTSIVFATSLVKGLVKIKNGTICNIFDNTNSPLQKFELDTQRLATMSLDFDINQHLWLSNYSSSKPLLVLTKDEKWKSYSIPFNGIPYIYNVFCDSRGILWIIYNREQSLILFDNKNTPLDASDDQWIELNTNLSAENGPFDYIYDIAEDHNGKIWIGTNAGLKVYHSPAQLMSNANIVPSPIAVQTITGLDTLVELVLKSETIRSICVDGGNRKWIGTENAGVFLLSEDARDEILHFTTENSPLLSNTILDIAIDGYSGEVYFATDKGLISFRYTATDGNEDQSNLKIFPNPVRGNYQGYISISGLVEDSEVKITDAQGNLVYRTRSNGGTAVWDGKRFDGQKVATGVYYVFVSGGNKMKLKKAGKILFIK